MEVARSLIKGVELRSIVAPCVSRAIVGADSRKPRNLWLYGFPIERESSATVLHDYRWRASTGAMDVQFAATHRDQLASGLRLDWDCRADQGKKRNNTNQPSHNAECTTEGRKSQLSPTGVGVEKVSQRQAFSSASMCRRFSCLRSTKW